MRIINGSDDVVTGNMIGTDATGNVLLGNAYDGIYVDSTASNEQIGGDTPGAGNVISGNAGIGVYIEPGSGGNTVAGNEIGTNAAGTVALGNSEGIVIGGTDNTVGGTTAAAQSPLFPGIPRSASTSSARRMWSKATTSASMRPATPPCPQWHRRVDRERRNGTTPLVERAPAHAT